MNFLTKIVAMKPGKTVQEMIKNVMEGKDEGADSSLEENSNGKLSGGITGRVRFTLLILKRKVWLLSIWL